MIDAWEEEVLQLAKSARKRAPTGRLRKRSVILRATIELSITHGPHGLSEGVWSHARRRVAVEGPSTQPRRTRRSNPPKRVRMAAWPRAGWHSSVRGVGCLLDNRLMLWRPVPDASSGC